MNLRWSWDPQTLDLFRWVDPDAWDAVGHDPVRLLGRGRAPTASTSWPPTPASSAASPTPTTTSRDYLTAPRWFQGLADAPALDRLLLARSSASPRRCRSTRAASASSPATTSRRRSDLGVPLVGVGLLYRHGYFRQTLNADGWQQERYPPSTRTACR